jgi:hypothetical protein
LVATKSAVAKEGGIDDGLLSALLKRTKAANLRAAGDKCVDLAGI